MFELDDATRRALGSELTEILTRYFASLPDRPVQLPLEQRTFSPLTDRMPEVGMDPVLALREIAQELIDKGFHVPSANYFGLMNPTPAYMAVMAEALVAALNPQLASTARSQLASRIEAEVVRWLCERAGWTEPAGGTFTSGGNEANFSALALALCHHFPSVAEEGVASLPAAPVLYTSSEAHHSLEKSTGLLGLGRRALRRIPVNDRIQLDPGHLERTIREDLAAGRKPFAVVATAGTTNSGAIDDLPALAVLCRRYGLWLHVDGAYGAAAILSDLHRELVRGIGSADSITLDPHKWLAMPFAAGVILTRHPHLLEQAFGVSTPYMPQGAPGAQTDNFKISTQWSRRMNSLKLWLTLRVHGRRAFERHFARQLELAHGFAARFAASPVFEVAAPIYLPILNLRRKDGDTHEPRRAAEHQRIVEEVTRSGERWISTTAVAGRSVIRVMIISYLTEARHLDALWKALHEAAQKPTAR
jgi:aromatic-L-amino-acid decarboxylase